ncbi:uncharacterized protein CYBJADRAFT_168638 [Cyberlindnera jadinii NRRL Y-1542]|uniref:Uncharacterized protein n=1 Tax=Cyberlindnera jadinii (strain ATCC 18201 / CBS 1600 / BCRC 20928 / JCM 3617 / NBRC 0987 / NRRL Y-1542) TaxID=983966 RepID=A0A1E4RYH8_CYBJN|nr:hypothetical protein CYBJADRAFT_168638 [Cyberlindnera jadinii NRRL Y-1542]ODV72327.1 hypothetical protein CYBJADRAFT_168638 [Cyberlindnera jadinii NRRL Y-1542]
MNSITIEQSFQQTSEKSSRQSSGTAVVDQAYAESAAHSDEVPYQHGGILRRDRDHSRHSWRSIIAKKSHHGVRDWLKLHITKVTVKDEDNSTLNVSARRDSEAVTIELVSFFNNDESSGPNVSMETTVSGVENKMSKRTLVKSWFKRKPRSIHTNNYSNVTTGNENNDNNTVNQQLTGNNVAAYLTPLTVSTTETGFAIYNDTIATTTTTDAMVNNISNATTDTDNINSKLKRKREFTFFKDSFKKSVDDWRIKRQRVESKFEVQEETCEEEDTEEAADHDTNDYTNDYTDHDSDYEDYTDHDSDYEDYTDHDSDYEDYSDDSFRSNGTYDPVTVLVPTIREGRYMISTLKNSIMEGETIKSVYGKEDDYISDDDKPFDIKDPRCFGIEPEEEEYYEEPTLYSKIKFEDFSEVVFYNGSGTLRQISSKNESRSIKLQGVAHSENTEKYLDGAKDLTLESSLTIEPRSILKSKVNKNRIDETIRLEECEEIGLEDFLNTLDDQEEERNEVLDYLYNIRDRQVVEYYMNISKSSTTTAGGALE